MGLYSKLGCLPEVPSCSEHLSVPWPELDQSSKGSWAIKGRVWCAALPGWGGCRRSQQLSSQCMALWTFLLQMAWNVHDHFLHPGCTGNHRRKSFTSFILHRNLLWLHVTIAVCYRKQIRKGMYPKAWSLLVPWYFRFRHLDLAVQSSYHLPPSCRRWKLPEKVYFPPVSQKPYASKRFCW